MAENSRGRRSMADYSVAVHAQGVSEGDARIERYRQSMGRHRAERSVWPGAAFIVEALLLLVFLAGSLAVLMNLNAAADRAGARSADMMDAIVMASNAAERFSADPDGFQRIYEIDSLDDFWFSEPFDDIASGSVVLHLSCSFTSEGTGAGSLWNAEFQVWRERVLIDEESRAAEGIEAEGVVFQRPEEEPVYTLKTAVYRPGVSAETAAEEAEGADAAGGADAAEGELVTVEQDRRRAQPDGGADDAANTSADTSADGEAVRHG